MNKDTQNKNIDVTAKKQRVVGRPFPKGVSGNPAGRPIGSVDPLKEIGRKIADKRIQLHVPKKQQEQMRKLGIHPEGNDISIIESIMLHLASSDNPAKIAMFIERTYGKTANININQNSSFDFMQHASKFTDSELEAIKNGADPISIISEKLLDVNELEDIIKTLEDSYPGITQILEDRLPQIFKIR